MKLVMTKMVKVWLRMTRTLTNANLVPNKFPTVSPKFPKTATRLKMARHRGSRHIRRSTVKSTASKLTKCVSPSGSMRHWRHRSSLEPKNLEKSSTFCKKRKCLARTEKGKTNLVKLMNNHQQLPK
jgi:hypothetical protein